jgi:hypothetical protein
MQVVLTRIDARVHTRPQQETNSRIKLIKKRVVWFIVTFFLFEALVLGIKGIIYLTGKVWTHISAWQISFLVLHAIRVIFPLTL